MRPYYIAPSLLAADFGKLREEIEMINASDADYLHLDIMDGRFVPNISYGQSIVKMVSKYSTKPLDVHLMIEEPGKYVEEFKDAGATIITIHAEACPHLHRNIGQIKDMGIMAGVALNPSTSVTVIEDVLELTDLVLIMSVNPGFGGQKFIYQSLLKIKKLRDMIDIINSKALIEIDGGVGLHNAQEIIKAGCDILVAGSSVFGAKDPIAEIAKFKSIFS